MKGFIRRTLSIIPMVLGFSCAAQAVQPAEAAIHPPGRNMDQMQFGNIPGLPTCLPGSVQSGDPAKGPAIIFGKLGTGCAVPWHWHTAGEHLMVVSGEVELQTKDAAQQTLLPGGYADLPPHHLHQVRCKQECRLYVSIDGAFDIHYVNAQGKEIPPAEALKAVNEIPAPGAAPAS